MKKPLIEEIITSEETLAALDSKLKSHMWTNIESLETTLVVVVVLVEGYQPKR